MSLRLYLILFFSICLSKEILVFNEELLIVFSFFVFLFLIYTLTSNQIGLELDLRANKIKQEFDFYIELQKETFKYLIQYYNKQKSLSCDIEKAFIFLKEDIFLIINTYSNILLKFLSLSIEDKLKKIFSLELKSYAFIKNTIILKLYDYLLIFFKKKTNISSSIFIKKAIIFLSKMNIYKSV